jgi:hypothetical protein
MANMLNPAGPPGQVNSYFESSPQQHVKDESFQGQPSSPASIGSNLRRPSMIPSAEERKLATELFMGLQEKALESEYPPSQEELNRWAEPLLDDANDRFRYFCPIEGCDVRFVEDFEIFCHCGVAHGVDYPLGQVAALSFFYEDELVVIDEDKMDIDEEEPEEPPLSVQSEVEDAQLQESPQRETEPQSLS